MYVTIDELLAFKAQYDEQIAELERKKAVVEELIAFAETKVVDKCEEVVEETEVVEEVESAEVETANAIEY